MASEQPGALKVQGRNGRYTLINGQYEPMQTQHNGKPCWASRAVQPVYIFHTGKARWVISKMIDDGARCFAYAKDTGGDPTTCTGWVCCNEDNEWRADPKVSCVGVPGSNDKFVQLRMSLEGEMKQCGVVGEQNLKQLWKRLDYNNNGIVSLAEIDKMVVELVSGGSWPAWLNNKPALMRAYKKTIAKDGNGDDWVQKPEFHALLLNIYWFNKLWQVFDVIDTGNDRRIDVNEFTRGISALGLQMSQSEAQLEFSKVDSNHGGQVLFVEFCAYIRKRVNPDANPEFDADIVSGEKCNNLMRKHSGHKATHTHYVKKKSFKDFDDLEKKIKEVMSDKSKLRELWDRLDYNGNNIVSLAEIDKLVVEKYPLLNHKPALMRAYKATINTVNRDDYVEKGEFKTLLGALFYYNKLFWLFDNVDGDHDRRMQFSEFKWCLNVCGCKATEQQARQDFSRIDRNGGGVILFDEFCLYFTSKMCPQAMQDLLD
mmetsp:Transcript_41377/g.74911  ORF Transcript_41377/g.74911 Transcript_41377/m.74911 type:complete len:485 (+) Transcript_41377:76-1530(+)